MYGLVNRAVHQLVEEQFGTDMWHRVCQKAGVDPAGFVAMQGYPDDITYRLVGAISEETGLSGAAILEAFGEYWVLYTGRQGYGALMESSGRNLPEFLANLDNLHTRVSVTYPELAPPSFSVEHEAPDRLRLHYFSHRLGLTHLVVGLVRGLGQMLHTPVQVSVDRRRDEGHDHDEFVIVYGEHAAQP